MKSAAFVSCLALALLLVAPCLGAQPDAQESPKIGVDVPFDFMVGQVMFPAGSYTIKSLQSRIVYLHASRGRESVSIAMKPLHTALHPNTPRLIFAEENGHYHLRELWMNSAIGIEVPAPRVAQLTAARRASVEVPATCITCP
jgi:hypothetical protein